MSVTVTALSKRIGGAYILADVSLHVPDGCIVGLAGINGSGKTMLMRAIAGLIRPTAGTVDVDGVRLWRDASFPPSVGLLIENPAFLDSRTGFDNLRLLASIKGIATNERIMHVLSAVGLNPNDKRKYRKYSLGMKQRLGLAAAIMEQPQLILLDEPANALDADGVFMLKSLVKAEKARGASIVLSCHDAVLLRELSDQILYMEAGRISGSELSRSERYDNDSQEEGVL